MSINNISKISSVIKEDDYNKLVDNELELSIVKLEEILVREKIRETLISDEISNKNLNKNVYTIDLLECHSQIIENIKNLEDYLENLNTKKRLLCSKKRLSFA